MNNCEYCDKEISLKKKYCNQKCETNYKKNNYSLEPLLRSDPCSCLICYREFNRYAELGNHLRHTHQLKSKDYYDKHVLSVGDKTLCICGKPLKFKSIKHGYYTMCSRSCSISMSGPLNHRFGKPNETEFSEEFKIACAKRLEEYRSKGMLKITDEGRKKLSISTSKNKKGNTYYSEYLRKFDGIPLENKTNGFCNFYKIGEIIVQGTYEFYFYMKNKDKINIFKPKPIKTPLGFYTPDFEIENKFIEIKCIYTAKTCFKGKQFKKIKWVSKNIKKVEILILKHQEVKDFLLEIDIKKYIYKATDRKKNNI